MTIKHFIFLFTFTISHVLWAQDDIVKFKNINIDHGLSQGTVSSIIKGKDGYIWIGTADGLNRYDGNTFRIFNTENSGLSDNYITSMAEYDSDFLVIGFFNGEIGFFNKKTFKCHIEKFNNYYKQISKSAIKQIKIHQQTVYIATENNGLIIFNKKTKTYWHKTQKNSILNSNSIKDIWIADNDIKIICNQSIYNIDIEKNYNITLFRTFHLSNAITSLVQLEDNYYLATYGSGLYSFKTQSDSLLPFMFPRGRSIKFINTIILNNNILYLATQGGLLVIQNNNVKQFKNNPLNPESLIDDNVNTITIDENNCMWVGTISGISFFDIRLKKFKLINTFKWNDSILNNNIYCIYQDPKYDYIWLGTLSSGLIKMDKNGTILKAWPLIKTTNLETKMVRTIFRDSKNRLWIGTRDKGLFLFNEQNNSFKMYNGTGKNAISNQTIRSIFEDKKGILWIGTGNGLNKLDVDNNSFIHYSYNIQNPSANCIYQIIEGRNQNELFLASFRGGFQIFNTITLQFEKPKLESKIDKKPLNQYAMSLLKYKNDIFIGTYGGGIYIYNFKTNKTKIINEKLGLANNAIYGMIKAREQLWVSTNRGLSCISLKDHSIKNYGIRHYLQNNEFNEGAYTISNDSTIYFGGVDGINYFVPQYKNNTIHKYPLVFTSINTLKSEINIKTSKNGKNTITLPYHFSLLSIQFSALNYFNIIDNSYQYMLEGFDDNWINAEHRNTAYFTRLNPGKYIFKVKCKSNLLEGESESQLVIIVKPPFWRTWWFYLLCIAAILFGIWFILKKRTQNIKKEFGIKMKDLELKALRSQMNPHFIFNSLNSIQYFILKNEPKPAYNYLTKFSSLMRLILQNSKSNTITLEDEIAWLKTYLELENVRLENTLKFNITIDKHINITNTLVPTMILQPYIENAIIHGLLPKTSSEKNIQVNIVTEDKLLIFNIIDDGIGRKASNELNKNRLKSHESTAMKLTHERLEMIQFDTQIKENPEIIDLFDSNQNAIGTHVKLYLPIIQSK